MTRAEILDCLTDRPCEVCKFHESGRCERWDCVFEEKSDEQKRKMFDGMTNGEVIGLLFPNVVFYHNLDFTLKEMILPDEWLDAPYKAESEDTE